jgi:branched-subunit amino acid transport protein
MVKLFTIVILMALATYIPRLIPMLFLNGIKLPPRLEVFLKYIPYAALGALIFPGVLDSTGDMPSALAGGMVSVILAYYRMNVIIVVFGGIGGVMLCNWLI